MGAHGKTVQQKAQDAVERIRQDIRNGKTIASVLRSADAIEWMGRQWFISLSAQQLLPGFYPGGPGTAWRCHRDAFLEWLADLADGVDMTLLGGKDLIDPDLANTGAAGDNVTAAIAGMKVSEIGAQVAELQRTLEEVQRRLDGQSDWPSRGAQ